MLGPADQNVDLVHYEAQALLDALALQLLGDRSLALDAAEEVGEAQGPLTRLSLNQSGPIIGRVGVDAFVPRVRACIRLPDALVVRRWRPRRTCPPSHA